MICGTLPLHCTLLLARRTIRPTTWLNINDNILLKLILYDVTLRYWPFADTGHVPLAHYFMISLVFKMAQTNTHIWTYIFCCRVVLKLPHWYPNYHIWTLQEGRGRGGHGLGHVISQIDYWRHLATCWEKFSTILFLYGFYTKLDFWKYLINEYKNVY